MSSRLSKHHLLHERRAWTSSPEANRLRNTPSLIPAIPRDIHDQLHIHCPPIPLLASHALQRAVKMFRPTGDTFQDMDRLMWAFEEAGRRPRTHPIERELADLAIEAVDLQRPFIREGLYVGD